VVEVEDLGFPGLWFAEASWRREALTHAALLLGATKHMVIATGIASIWARDAVATASAQRLLGEAWPHRFVLGLGVSHEFIVAGRGHRYERPLRAMSGYLEAMDSGPADAGRTIPSLRVVAALGPKMLELARDQADGAHTFMVPPEHTLHARAVIGPERVLIPQQAVYLGDSEQQALVTLRRELTMRLSLPNYRESLRRLGWQDDDLDGGGSDRLLERLYVWGSPDRIAARLQEHLDAGADQVAVHALGAGEELVKQWRRLAEIVR
jgi:probable F420-dependent oxidoreductase